MAKVFPLSRNVEYRKAKRKEKKKPESQLSLFMESANIFHLQESYSYFEYALYLDDSDDPNAVEAYIRSIEENDCPVDSYCNLGIIESKKNNNDKAFTYFLSALKLNPSHFETHLNMANLYFEEKDFKCALLHYKIARTIWPGFTPVLFNIGLSNLMLQNYDEALEYLIIYKETNPDNRADDLISILADYLK